MEHTIRVRAVGITLIISAAIAVSAVTSTVVASRAYRDRAEQTARTQQELTVKGSARTSVRSDLAVWSIVITSAGPELKQAYESLEQGVDRVQAFLIEQGFDDSELSLTAISTSTHFVRDGAGRETSQVNGYTLRRAYEVTTANVDRVAMAAGEVTSLLRENVQVSSAPPEYTYSKVADLKISIVGDASRDALDRATQIASNAGCSVGEVRRASMGVIQITRPHSTQVSGYGIYDTSTIDKEISVVVTVTFAVLSAD